MRSLGAGRQLGAFDEHAEPFHIAGTGSHLPARNVPNAHFLGNEFYDADGGRIERPTSEIIEKFQKITGITERRWVTDDLVTSDIALLAAEDALQSAGVDPESLDHVIVAHNFGDIRADSRRSDLVPSLAARVKATLGIENPRAISYDLPFGCPGWLQGLIQADCFLSAGRGKRALVIGAETLSRVSDPHDRDSMIYADGAGAVVLESVATDKPVGVLSDSARSDTLKHAHLLSMGRSYKPDYAGDALFLKMRGHNLYEYALRTVPQVVKDTLEKAGVVLGDVRKVLLHQANVKMDEAIVHRLCNLCGVRSVAPEIVPMTISCAPAGPGPLRMTFAGCTLSEEPTGRRLASANPRGRLGRSLPDLASPFFYSFATFSAAGPFSP